MRVQVGTVVSGIGVLGAGAWVARWATDLDPLLWVGAALLTVVAVAAGAGMVKPVPLRAVVGVCLALLCWSLGAVAGLDGDPVRAGVVGLVLMVVVPVGWERVRPVGPRRALRGARAGRADRRQARGPEAVGGEASRQPRALSPTGGRRPPAYRPTTRGVGMPRGGRVFTGAEPDPTVVHRR